MLIQVQNNLMQDGRALEHYYMDYFPAWIQKHMNARHERTCSQRRFFGILG